MIISREIFHKAVILFSSLLWLSSCAGPPVESYQTKVEKFSWGKVHVWMGTQPGSGRNDKQGSGYLLIDFIFKKNVIGKDCSITLTRAYLENSKSGVVLIDVVPTFSESSPMTKKIKQYKTGQLGLRNYPFEWQQDAFPYDVKINMNFDCEGKQTQHSFAKPIEFRMVQPVAWEQ